MASFCTKCGTELPAGAQVCAACGAPVAALSAAALPPQPVAVAPTSGNNALKIVLIVLAVFIGLGILGAAVGAFFVWRVAHSVHVSGSGDQVTVHTPGGTISTDTSETYTASELGTDIYPGAVSGKGSVRLKMAGNSVVTAVFLTSDSKDQVLAFYKNKFGSDASIYDSSDETVLTVNKGESESVVVTLSKGSGDNQGKTEIHIVHTTTAKPS